MSEMVRKIYKMIQKGSRDLPSEEVGDMITNLHGECIRFLEQCERYDAVSKIPGKRYFVFATNLNGQQKFSRAVNVELFTTSRDQWDLLRSGIRNNDFASLDPASITKAIYSLAISFCVSIDLTSHGDQKTPGTFFEYLIGHLFAARINQKPRRKLDVLNLDMKTQLPTDFVFDLGSGRAKFHLPIKTSTRERIIQVWAHQRVLDGVYGTGRFLGMPVIMTETKTNSNTLEVMEICLPDQWRIYQMHIAQLKRIYYLDVPYAYSQLNNVFPPLHVRPFGEFFIEIDSLM